MHTFVRPIGMMEGMSLFMLLCWLGGILLVVLLVVVIMRLLKK